MPRSEFFQSRVSPLLNQRISSVETSLTRRENVLSFLVIRFVFMSGMVIGFAWTFLHFSP